MFVFLPGLVPVVSVFSYRSGYDTTFSPGVSDTHFCSLLVRSTSCCFRDYRYYFTPCKTQKFRYHTQSDTKVLLYPIRNKRTVRVFFNSVLLTEFCCSHMTECLDLRPSDFSSQPSRSKVDFRSHFLGNGEGR